MKIHGGLSTILFAVPIEIKISRGTEIRNRRYVRICFVIGNVFDKILRSLL